MKKLNLFLLLIVFASKALWANENVEKWSCDLSSSGISKFDWVKSLNAEIVLVGNNAQGVCAVSAQTKNLLWKYNEAFGSYSYIPETELLMLNSAARLVLMDSKTGKIITDTKADGLEVEGYNLLPEINALVIGLVNKKAKLKLIYCIDIVKKELRWKAELGGTKSGLMARVYDQEAGKFMYTDKDGNIVVVINKTVARFNSLDGTLMWKLELGKRIIIVSNAFLAEDGETLLVASTAFLAAVDVMSGKEIHEPIRVKGEIQKFFQFSEDQILIPTTMSCNVYNTKSKNYEWEKSAMVGNIARFWLLNDGFLTIDETQPDYSYVYKIGFDGKRIWNRNMAKFSAANVCQSGFFYIIPSKSQFLKNGANIMNLENGGNVWEKSLPLANRRYFDSYEGFEGGGNFCTYDENTKILTLLSGKELYQFDLVKGEYKIIAKDIVFEDEKGAEQKVTVETTHYGYVLYTSQNIIVLDQSGQLVYKKNYRLPGSYQKVEVKRKGFGGFLQDELLGKQTKTVYNSNEASANRKTQSSEKNLFVLTDINENPCILVVEKQTGKEVFQVPLQTTAPIYHISDATQSMFVIVGKSIEGYRMK